MTVNEILGWSPDQFMRLTKPELKEATQILASAGNKRIKRAQAEGFGSASIDAVLKKGKFSTADKSFAQLRNEFTRARSFLQSKTGTLSEIAKFKKESIAILKFFPENKRGRNISKPILPGQNYPDNKTGQR